MLASRPAWPRPASASPSACSDTGPGIPEEIRDHLFESFATHGKEDGTGLGLAIVKRIAEEHGGSVECRTRSGQGTTFVLSIPA